MRLEIKVPYNLNYCDLINQSLNSIKNLKNNFLLEILIVFILIILIIK